MTEATLYCGDALAVLKTLPAASIQCVVTSPPYWGLRDYGTSGQRGLEATPDIYVEDMCVIFEEVRRVLRQDGTVWLNMGDSYIAAPAGNHGARSSGLTNGGHWQAEKPVPVHRGVRQVGDSKNPNANVPALGPNRFAIRGLKSKDLVGMPWRLAFALQADGWWLRSDIIWSKPNPMPESVTDRPTKSHEYVFLLSKSKRYYYNADAIRTSLADKTFTTFGCEHYPQGDTSGMVKSDNWGRTVKVHKPRLKMPDGWDTAPGAHGSFHRQGREKGAYEETELAGANARTVWEIATQPYPEAHFATFPEELARRCILAGSRPGDTVLDPFGGSGTVAQVATGNGRNSIYIDLNPKYVELARQRIGPLLCQTA